METVILSYALLDEFNNLQKLEKSKIPYQLNLIDELGANENAHSRLFLKFLSYKSCGEFLFLRKFLDSLGEEFSKIKIINPVFTAEKERIDALVSDRDGNYSIIIENKINNAPDQPTQIIRYIDKQKKNGFKIDNIYVLYLTENDNNKEPSGDSFPKEHDYRKQIESNGRYSEINFKREVLEWLKSLTILCKQDEILLKSALLQYIDYLEGRFNQREIETNMNKELKIFIKEKIKLTNNDYTNVEVINSEIEKLNNLNDHFQSLQNEAFQNIILNWKAKMSNNQNYTIITNIENNKIPKYMYLGYFIKINNINVVCAIGIDSIKDTPYFGLTTRGCENEKKNLEVIEYLKKFDGFTSSPRWYLLRENKLENIFEEFNRFMNENITGK